MLGRRKQNAIDVAGGQAGHRAGRLVLVGVREAGERSRGYVPGSRHLPLAEVKHRLDELPADRPVAFICQSGRRSAMAAAAARSAGLDAHNVSGGMTAWERQGLNTDTTERT